MLKSDAKNSRADLPGFTILTAILFLNAASMLKCQTYNKPRRQWDSQNSDQGSSVPSSTTLRNVWPKIPCSLPLLFKQHWDELLHQLQNWHIITNSSVCGMKLMQSFVTRQYLSIVKHYYYASYKITLPNMSDLEIVTTVMNYDPLGTTRWQTLGRVHSGKGAHEELWDCRVLILLFEWFWGILFACFVVAFFKSMSETFEYFRRLFMTNSFPYAGIFSNF